MPSGQYEILERGAVVGAEAFRSAPGPMGWRYFSTAERTAPARGTDRFDLSVDAAWRPVRVRVQTPRHELLLAVRGEVLTGSRDAAPLEIPYGPDVHVDAFSPAFNIASARRLGASAEIEVIFIDPVTLEHSLERQRYETIGADEVRTRVGTFEAERWRYTALGSGFTTDFWLAGEVLVRYEGVFELISYDAGGSGPRPL